MRCDTLKSRHVQSLSVSIHTPTWGVTPLCILLLCLIFVSIHTPTWGVTHHAILLVTKSWFQSTHLHEVWLVLLHFDWLPLGFNPHTYMRCDAIIPSISSFRNVSIHTPTWGVTPHYTNLGISGAFQSTHLHEVWPIGLVHLLIVGGFNPHTYMRCDSLNNLNWSILGCFNPHTYMRCDTHARDIQWCQAVSIHTPTWGVTLLSEVPDRIIRFQSTHLHEVWPRPLSGRWSGTSFNPHTYMRCDVFEKDEIRPLNVSIHTPTWGVTSHVIYRIIANIGFNPHTYMRCDPI